MNEEGVYLYYYVYPSNSRTFYEDGTGSGHSAFTESDKADGTGTVREDLFHESNVDPYQLNGGR